jgi:hypothetical protein
VNGILPPLRDEAEELDGRVRVEDGAGPRLVIPLWVKGRLPFLLLEGGLGRGIGGGRGREVGDSRRCEVESVRGRGLEGIGRSGVFG